MSKGATRLTASRFSGAHGRALLFGVAALIVLAVSQLAVASAQAAEPNQVVGLTATQNEGFATLAWEPVAGATDYQIERTPVDAANVPTGASVIVGLWQPHPHRHAGVAAVRGSRVSRSAGAISGAFARASERLHSPTPSPSSERRGRNGARVRAPTSARSGRRAATRRTRPTRTRSRTPRRSTPRATASASSSSAAPTRTRVTAHRATTRSTCSSSATRRRRRPPRRSRTGRRSSTTATSTATSRRAASRASSSRACSRSRRTRTCSRSSRT